MMEHGSNVYNSLLLVLLLSGCGLATPESRAWIALSMRAGPECRAEVGHEPYGGLNWMGAAGAVVLASTAEHRAWHDRYAACMERKAEHG